MTVNSELDASGVLKGYNFDLYDIFTKPALGIPVLTGGLGGAAGVAALFNSYGSAPNPGFADAISNLYVASTAIGSWLLFKTPLSHDQLIGIILSGVAISLLST